MHRPGTLFGARYREANIQIFSLGRGRLPTGEGAAAYLHLRVAVANTANRGSMRVDPREQLLWVAARAMIPVFADSDGKPGILHVPPQGRANLDLFYRMTADIEDAVFAWQAWDAEGKAISQRLGLQALQAPGAPTQTALWVPKGEEEESYTITAMDRWTEPSHDWYWWRESDFPAWPSGVVRIGREASAPSPSVHQTTWYWFDDPYVEIWPSFAPAGGGGTIGGRAAAASREDSSTPPPRKRSGWRRVLRAPPSRAPDSTPLRVDTRTPRAEADREDEPSSSEPARSWRRTRTSSESAPQRASQPSSPRPRQSTSSSVGRSWRSKGR